MIPGRFSSEREPAFADLNPGDPSKESASPIRLGGRISGHQTWPGYHPSVPGNRDVTVVVLAFRRNRGREQFSSDLMIRVGRDCPSVVRWEGLSRCDF